MDDRNIKIAEKYGIFNHTSLFKKDLMAIDGVARVEFDLSGFADNMHEIIVLIGYNINSDLYYEKRKEMIGSIVEIAKKHGLSKTEDRIEDYGQDLYFVFHHNGSWDCRRLVSTGINIYNGENKIFDSFDFDSYESAFKEMVKQFCIEASNAGFTDFPSESNHHFLDEYSAINENGTICIRSDRACIQENNGFIRVWIILGTN